MKNLLISFLTLALVTALHAAPGQALRYNDQTKAVADDIRVPAGRTISIGTGGKLKIESGAIFEGSFPAGQWSALSGSPLDNTNLAFLLSSKADVSSLGNSAFRAVGTGSNQVAAGDAPAAAQTAAIAAAATDATTKANAAQAAAIAAASTDATTKANAAQASATSAASTDATTKANAAQAVAVQRANHTGLQPTTTLSQTGATVGQTMKWNGSQWLPADDITGSGGIADGNKGDVTVSGSGTTISLNSDSVNAAKIAASLKPSGTAGAGTEALRALGTAAGTAAAGNDSRLSDQRVPTDASVTAVKVAGALKPSGTAAAGDEALRALGTTAGTAAAGNDNRFAAIAGKAAGLTVSALGSNNINLNPTSSSDVIYTATWTGTPVTFTYTGGTDTAGERQRMLITVTSPTVLTVTPTSSTVYRNGALSALSSTITFPVGRYWVTFTTPDTGTNLLMEDSVISGADIPLIDAGNYFTTDNVEAALQQLAASSGGGASVSDTAYDATSWDGVTTVAPSKNAVRDKIESLTLAGDAFGSIKLWATADIATPLAAGWLACDGTNGTLTLADVSGGARYIVKGGGAVAAPSFSPAAGTYSSTQSVTISSATSGATIKYTVDGSTPSRSVGTTYSTPVSIAATSTLKAIAYKNLFADSSVTSGTYTISGGGGTSGTFTENFNSFAGGASLDAQTGWVAILNDLTISANGAARGVYKSTGAGTEAILYYSPLAGTGDQYAQMFVKNINGTSPAQFGLLVRGNSTSGGNGYYVIYASGMLYVNKLINGTSSTVDSFALGGFSVDDGVRFEVTGTGSSTRLNVYKSVGGGGFFQISGPTDPGAPYLSGGSPGLAGYNNLSSSADMDDVTLYVAP